MISDDALARVNKALEEAEEWIRELQRQNRLLRYWLGVHRATHAAARTDLDDALTTANEGAITVTDDDMVIG